MNLGDGIHINDESNGQENFESSTNGVLNAVRRLEEAILVPWPPLVSDPCSADVTQEVKSIQYVCQRLTSTPSLIEKITLAAIIAKHVSALCDSCRIASSKTSDSVVRQNIVKFAEDAADSMANLVLVIMGSNKKDQPCDNKKEEEDSVIPSSSQTPSTTVMQSVKHTSITEQCPDISCNATPKTSNPLRNSTPTKSNSEYTNLYISVGLLVTVIASVLGAVQYYRIEPGSLQILNFLRKTTSSSPQIDVVTIMDNMYRNFNEQPSMTFKIVKSAIRKLNKINPKGPVIIALLAEQGSADVSDRFAHHLVESVSPYSDVVTISGHALSELTPDSAKKAIDDLLNRGLKENELGAVFVDRLDYIPGDAALIFHTYCNGKSAKFKRVVYVMTVVSNQTQLKLVRPNYWDSMFQEHLYKSWSVLGSDQVSSLVSRLDVSVAVIVPEGES